MFFRGNNFLQIIYLLFRTIQCTFSNSKGAAKHTLLNLRMVAVNIIVTPKTYHHSTLGGV